MKYFLLALALESIVLPSLPAAGGDGSSYFKSWPAGASPREIGERVTKHFLDTPHPNFGSPKAPGGITYPESITWYGALTFARLAGDKELTRRLIERFEPLFGAEAGLIPNPTDVDSTVFGAVPLEISLQTGIPKYLDLGKSFADRQWQATPGQKTKLTPETLANVEKGLSWHTRYWIDDMYMITLIESQAFRATGDPVYLDRAALEMTAYLDKLQQPNGLFFHAPDVPFYWGRGNGWMAAGMAELLSSLPSTHPHRAKILAGYRKMMATLLETQDATGMWRQLVDDPKSWPETSCTGMFTFAMITGVKNGWLDAKTYGPAARKGWLALVGYINENADVREVCAGTNKKNDRQYYLDRSRKVGDMHGQAPVLWCATALLR